MSLQAWDGGAEAPLVSFTEPSREAASMRVPTSLDAAVHWPGVVTFKDATGRVGREFVSADDFRSSHIQRTRAGQPLMAYPAKHFLFSILLCAL